jgi:tRNA threonylcarbamoyladenosine biosynthesis protein TsaB
MGLILNIDTAVNTASVCLAKDGEALAFLENDQQQNHAEWLHGAIKNIFEMAGLVLESTEAVAVTEGPGSYTGLRISMAAAKGICYALDKPLICLNTLLVMADAARNKIAISPGALLCPMIDARRMEVYTALFTSGLSAVTESAAIILDEKSFNEELSSRQVYFFGNGSDKFKTIQKKENAFFEMVNANAVSMIKLSEKKFAAKEFADLAYAEPQYLKEFFTTAKK